jgi:DNA transposition AAA+ family ATPase
MTEKSEIIQTQPVRQAVRMAEAVLSAADTGTIGRLIGEPGTGKTATGHHLANKFGGIRICCAEGDNKRAVALGLHAAFLPEEKARGSVPALRTAIKPHCAGRLLIVDEANHLRWPELEFLRWFADEAGLGLILIGTELLEETFLDGRNRTRLAQLASRIGAKTVRFGAFETLEDFTGYCIVPEFGPVNAATAKAFHKKSRGYWRDARQLAQACKTLMEAQSHTHLTTAIVEAAASWMAPARIAA